jgi:hypothetical protein
MADFEKALDMLNFIKREKRREEMFGAEIKSQAQLDTSSINRVARPTPLSAFRHHLPGPAIQCWRLVGA